MGASIVTIYRSRQPVQGFSLIEIALVLLILGLILKSTVMPLAALREHALQSKAEEQVQLIRDTLFAFVVAYGALPCPLLAGGTLTRVPLASNALNALESSTTPCGVPSGFVPAQTLGLTGALSDTGALLDPWNREYRYAVSVGDSAGVSTEANTRVGSNELNDMTGFWTVPGRAASVGVGELSAELVLCHATTQTNCSGLSVRSDQIAFVVLSTGRDGSSTGVQHENLDGDNYYTVAEESVVDGAEYDDIVSWGSAADVMYWMLRMGWLP